MDKRVKSCDCNSGTSKGAATFMNSTQRVIRLDFFQPKWLQQAAQHLCRGSSCEVFLSFFRGHIGLQDASNRLPERREIWP